VNRTTDLSAIEARLLELAHTTDAKITAPALAYFAPCSIEDASKVLDDLTVKGQLSMEVDDDGVIFYEMPGRQHIKHAAPQLPVLQRIAPRTIVRQAPFVHTPSPMLAGVLSLFIPGAGHLYAGKFLSAFLWFLVVGAGYTLLLPGLVLHLFCAASATAAASRIRFRALMDEGRYPTRLLAA
jgi:hypothetical protein